MTVARTAIPARDDTRMRIVLIIAAAAAIAMVAAVVAISLGYFPGARFTPPA